jgi:dTDP-4-dehydrorhamnose 3,5-epimerase
VRDDQPARPSVRPDGSPIVELIEGIKLKEMPNVITRNGVTTEVFRSEWKLDGGTVAQIIHVWLRPRAISAWHCHALQTDRIFVTDGTIKLALFDARGESPTRGRVTVLTLSRLRPTLVVVPPGVWHGLENLEQTPSAFVNFFDRAYSYEDPDEWRLPQDTDQIPYRF